MSSTSDDRGDPRQTGSGASGNGGDAAGYGDPAAGYGADRPVGYGTDTPVAYGADPAGGYGAGAAAGYGPAAPQPKNGLGIAALVFGILAVVLSWTVIGGIVLGIAAIVLGFLGRGRSKRGEATSGGISLAGLILGILGVLLSIALVAIGVSLFKSSGGDDLVNCVNKAGGDQARVQQCQRDFKDQLQN